MKTRTISNTDSVIDSRDVIERIEHLQGEIEAEIADDDEKAELDALLKLQEEAEDYSPDWRYGSTLIRDSHFRDYAKELAEDIGAISKDLRWPFFHIDWDAAAEALQVDYTAVDFNGVTYWVR